MKLTQVFFFTLLLYCSVHFVYSNIQCLLHMCITTEHHYGCRTNNTCNTYNAVHNNFNQFPLSNNQISIL